MFQRSVGYRKKYLEVLFLEREAFVLGVHGWDSWLGVCDSGSAGLGVQGWRGGTLGPRFAGAAAAARFALAALQPQQKSDRDFSIKP